MYMLRCLVGVSVVLAVSPTGALADGIGPLGQIEITWGDGDIWVSTDDTIGVSKTLADGSTVVYGSWATEAWGATWELLLGPNFFVALDATLTSNLPDPAQFGFSAVRISDIAIPAPTSVFGSTSGNLLDNVAFGDGAEVSALPGGSLYVGSINEPDHEFPMLTGAVFTADPFETESWGPEQFTDPNGPAFAVGDQIRIRHDFILSGFDTVQMVSTFGVPEPSCLVLLGLGGLMALRRGRR